MFKYGHLRVPYYNLKELSVSLSMLYICHILFLKGGEIFIRGEIWRYKEIEFMDISLLLVPCMDVLY